MATSKSKKKNQDKSIDTYFYSNKKKKSGEYKTDYKAIFNDVKKYTKWAFYLFLLVVSLWGCFQSFVVSTNPQIGKGLEVYTKYEDVYSNNFAVKPVIARANPSPDTQPKDIGGNDILDSTGTNTINTWDELGMKDVQTYVEYMAVIGTGSYISSIDRYWNPEKDVVEGTADSGLSTKTEITDSSGNVLTVSQLSTSLSAEISNFFSTSKIYLVPDTTYSGVSIAPSNITNSSSKIERGSDWYKNDAKSDDRIDNAGWTVGVVSSQEQHSNDIAQTQFSGISAPTYVSIEEYFMDPLYPDSGLYNKSIPYAISSELYDYEASTNTWEFKDDPYTIQDDLSKSISEKGLVASNSEDLNNIFDPTNSAMIDNNISDLSIRTYEITNYSDYYEDYYDDTVIKNTKQSVNFEIGGFATLYNSSEDNNIGITFDEAFSSFNMGEIDKQLDSREIVVSWSDAWEFGPFYGLFVWPISQFSLWVGTWIAWSALGVWSAILGVIFIVLVLRALSTLISIKSFTESAKTQEIQLKTAEVNAKYAIYDKSNKEMMSKKQQETMAIYKKEGLSPFGSIGTMLLTMPIFLAMWRVISALPFYKIGEIAGISFGSSSLSALFGGAPAALLIMIPVCFIQYVSFKAPTWLAKKRKGVKNIDEKTKQAMKKSNRMSNFMGIFFIIIGLTIPSLLAIYWIISGLYTIIISLTQHYVLLRKAETIRLERLGTNRKEEIKKGNIIPWYTQITNKLLGNKKVEVKEV